MKVYGPWLRNFGYSGECDTSYSWGCGRGYRFVGDGGEWRAEYPSSRWTMQFMCVGMGGMTMYLANLDPLCSTKDFFLSNGRFFGFGQFADDTGLPGNQFKQNFDVAIGPVRGIWYDAAKLYRQWVIKQPFCSEGPLLARSEGFRRAADCAVIIRPDYNHTEEVLATVRPDILPKYRTTIKAKEVEWNTDFLGTEKIGIHWYAWYKERMDDYLPAFTPWEDVHGVFKKYSDMGIVQTPYTISEMLDLAYEPAMVAYPDRCVRIGGGFLKDNWGQTPDFFVCPDSSIKSKLQIDVCTKLKNLNSNGAYLDVLNARIMDCYNPSHSHPKGIGGSWWVQAQRRTVDDLRRAMGPDFALMPEYFNESTIDKFSHFLSSIWVESVEVPLIPAVYSGYATIFGSRGDETDDPVSFRIRTGRPLLWGGILSTLMFSYYLDKSDTREFMKQCVDIKRANSRYLNFGEMLRPPALEGDMSTVVTTMWKTDTRREDGKEFDAVEATLWKSMEAGDTSRFVLLVNYDDKPHEVLLPLKQVEGYRPGMAVYAVDSTGQKTPMPYPTAAHGDIVLPVVVPAASPMGVLLQAPLSLSNSSIQCTTVADHPFIRLRHKDLPDQSITVRLPEYINLYVPMVAHDVVWKKSGDKNAQKLAFHWNASPEDKVRGKADFNGEVSLCDDGFEILFTLKYLTDLGPFYWMWDALAGINEHFGSYGSNFIDEDGVRTFHHHKDRFVSINELEGGRGRGYPMGGFELAKDANNPKPNEITERLAAKVSQDAKWVLAIASDIGNASSYNLAPHTNCIHQNYVISSAKAGTEQTIRLKVYIFKGTLDDLLARYDRDFK